MGNEWNWTVCNYKLQLVFTWLRFVFFLFFIFCFDRWNNRNYADAARPAPSIPLYHSFGQKTLEMKLPVRESRAKTHLLWQEVRLSAALRNISLHKQEDEQWASLSLGGGGGLRGRVEVLQEAG